MNLAVAAIVEGHGEVASVRLQLQRIASHVSGSAHVEVLRPIRIPRGKIVREPEIRRSGGP